MHYQVSRNGQMYGPYTLDDLKRYLSSGNVLPTDMAKSEDMPEWITVEQLMGREAANPFGTAAPNAAQFSATEGGSQAFGAGQPEANQTGTNQPGSGAYQPGGFTTSLVGDTPAAGYMPQQTYGAPAVNAAQYQDPPNLSWGLYLLFAVLTCGLFSKVFTVIQAAWLKRVQPNSNGLYFYIGLYVLWIISLFFGFGAALSSLAHPGMRGAMFAGPTLIRLVLQFLYLLLLFFTRFIMSASLEEHFNGPEPIGLKLNPVMVFFFGGVYFQSQFNRINALKQAARYGSAPRPY